MVNPKIQEKQELHPPRQGEVNSNSKLYLHFNQDSNTLTKFYK